MVKVKLKTRKKISFSGKHWRKEMEPRRENYVLTYTMPQKNRISRMAPRTIRYQPKSLKSCFFT